MTDSVVQNLIPKLTEYYNSAIAIKNKKPSMVELVNIAVQMIQGEKIPNEQKFNAVKNAVIETIKQLDLPDEEKEKMINATFLIDDMIETGVTLIKKDKNINNIFNSILACIGCAKSLQVKYHQ